MRTKNTETESADALAKLAEITAPLTPGRTYGSEKLDNVREMIRTLSAQALVSLPRGLFDSTRLKIGKADATWTALNQAQDDDRARADYLANALYSGAISVDQALTFGERLMRGRDGHGHAFNIVRRTANRWRDDAVAEAIPAAREAHALIVAAMDEVVDASRLVDEFDPSAGDLLDKYTALSALARETTCKVTGLKVPAPTPTLIRTHAEREAERDIAQAAKDAADARRDSSRLQRLPGNDFGRR
ncbi:hypothetical protein [Kribbella sp. NPDC006257]|uniref:hypothetical protein n=1 Tax=Kribbella sp. NPDC006257 TaxID=3156738 RepID=UPI0033B91653